MLKNFSYTVIEPAGKERRGEIAAEDRKDALARLKAGGTAVLDLREKGAPQRRFSLRKGISREETYNVVRELSTLLRSGMQIDKALDIVSHSVEKDEMKELLSAILKQVRSGKSVAASFEETKRFTPFFIGMIHNNEQIGRLSEAFDGIARYLRFQIQFNGEIRDALTYPIFLIATSIVTFFIIFQFIVPRFLGLFGASAHHLPATARFLFTMSHVLTPGKIIMAVVVASAAYVLGRPFLPKDGLAILKERLIGVPVLGDLLLNLELSRFSYSMHAMLDAGVEFIKALGLSTALVRNGQLREGLEDAAKRIREGAKIVDAFSQISVLPSMIPHMIRVGEESGNLREIFLEMHQICDERFKTGVRRALALLEPAIIIVMGLLVGFIVLTLIQTVMSVGAVKF